MWEVEMLKNKEWNKTYTVALSGNTRTRRTTEWSA